MSRARRTMDQLEKPRQAVTNPGAGEKKSPAPQLQKKKKTRFWRIYTIVLVVGCLLVTGAIILTRSALGDYEAARPGYVAEKVFQDYFNSDDYKPLLDKSGFALSEVETEDDFAEFWLEQTKGELSFVRVSSDAGGVVRYNVRSGEKTFAAFELSLNGKTSSWGNHLYDLSKIELGVGAKFSARITAPSDAIVKVNGVVLTDESIVEKDIETSSCQHMPEGVRGITLATYQLKGLLKEPVIEVTSKDGKALNVSYDETTKTHVADVLYDEQLKEEMSAYAIEAAQAYAASMQNDVPRSRALSYLLPGTTLYEQTRTLQLFVDSHSGYRFEQVKAEEFYRYDENTFSCRVSFVHVLTGGSTKFDENGENRENVDITWYFTKEGDKYLIYDRENN